MYDRLVLSCDLWNRKRYETIKEFNAVNNILTKGNNRK